MSEPDVLRRQQLKSWAALHPTGNFVMTIKSTKGIDDLRVEFPARMLLDLLAGRMTEEQSRRQFDKPGSKNIFEHCLSSGMIISRAEMAPRDIDDDDHIVLYFSDDPAACAFELAEN